MDLKYKNCPNCKGAKQVSSLGQIKKKCPGCKGVGKVEVNPKIKESTSKKSTPKKPKITTK